MGLTIIYK